MLFIEATSLKGCEMRRQYLHLCIYRCDNCEGPVVTGSLAVRENEISERSEIRELGAMCLSCGKKQAKPADLHASRYIPAVPWEQTSALDAVRIATAPLDYISTNCSDEIAPPVVAVPQSRMLLVELDTVTPIAEQTPLS
ncbi:MAG: hypothetical protein JWO13_482 [Acidobacteriales bacterium]|nr:hypothetical protein [Terriglobales bacterium]